MQDSLDIMMFKLNKVFIASKVKCHDLLLKTKFFLLQTTLQLTTSLNSTRIVNHYERPSLLQKSFNYILHWFSTYRWQPYHY
jgi:hypothetical protein